MDNSPRENSTSNNSPSNAQGLVTGVPVDQQHGHPQHPHASLQSPASVSEAPGSGGVPRPAAATVPAPTMTAMSRFLSSQQTAVGSMPGVPPANPGPGAGMPMDMSQGPPPASRPMPSMMDVEPAFPSSMPAEGLGPDRGMPPVHAHIPVPNPAPISSFRPSQPMSRPHEASGGPPPLPRPYDRRPDEGLGHLPPGPTSGFHQGGGMYGPPSGIMSMMMSSRGEEGPVGGERRRAEWPMDPNMGMDPVALLEARSIKTEGGMGRRGNGGHEGRGGQDGRGGRYSPATTLPQLTGMQSLATEEVMEDLSAISAPHDAEEYDLLSREKFVYYPTPDPFARKLAAREHERRMLRHATLDDGDQETDDEEADDEDDEDDDEEEEEVRRPRRSAGHRGRRRPAPQPVERERPPSTGPGQRSRPPSLEPVGMDVDEASEDEDVFDNITTPLPTEFVVAEAERAQYEAAFESLKTHMMRTFQTTDQSYKRNGYALKLLQGMCHKEARVVAMRRRKAMLLKEVTAVIRNRKECSQDIKARIRALRERIAEVKKTGGAMDVGDEADEDDEHEEDKEDDFAELLADEDVGGVMEEGEEGADEREWDDDNSDESASSDDEMRYKNEGEPFEEGDRVVTPDGQGVVTARERRGNVVVRFEDRRLHTYKVADVKPRPPPPGTVLALGMAIPADGAGGGRIAVPIEKDVVKAWMNFEERVDKMGRIAGRALKESTARFVQEFEMDAYFDQRHSMNQNRGDDDYDVYGKPMALRAKGKRASSGDEAGSGMPPASLFTSARGVVPYETPLMLTPLVGLPDHVAGVFHLNPPCKPDRSDVLERCDAIRDATFSKDLHAWSEDKRRLADLKAEVIRLEFQVKSTKQQTEEIAKWSTEALQGLNKVKAQLGGLGNDVENLKFKHQYELEIAKIPLSEAATEDIGKLEGEFSAADLPQVPVGQTMEAGKGTLDDDELDEESRAAKLRRLEAEEEAEAQHMVEEEKKREAEEEEEERRRRRRRSRAGIADMMGQDEEEEEEEGAAYDAELGALPTAYEKGEEEEEEEEEEGGEMEEGTDGGQRIRGNRRGGGRRRGQGSRSGSTGNVPADADAPWNEEGADSEAHQLSSALLAMAEAGEQAAQQEQEQQQQQQQQQQQATAAAATGGTGRGRGGRGRGRGRQG